MRRIQQSEWVRMFCGSGGVFMRHTGLTRKVRLNFKKVSLVCGQGFALRRQLSEGNQLGHYFNSLDER